MVDSLIQEVQLHPERGGPGVSKRLSNETKRKHYHNLILAIAVPINLCLH